MKELSGDYLTLFLAGIFGMLLLSVALVIFFVLYQRRILAEERKRVEKEKVHQLALLSAAVEVQETERRRIASDLHDDIGSLLSATRLYLQQLSADASAEKTESIKTESLNILDEMIQNTRRITHDLLPPVLEKFGFQAAAEDLCERINKSGSIHVSFSSNIDERLAPKREIALYRVLQELVNNTLKHAGAKNIDVNINWARNLFSFVYQDDGKGFEQTEQVGKGLGLRNIESRISLINGNLESISKPGEGIRVDITLPT
ncbi:sensor histidine kinase [Neolewinella persica]|uniref:sensor histidine kinase n=1 Tax=Neolewinella persica TaxID=70998 RepID=UPI00037FE391|nr:sensor histidine kinase [Neolewinella persica]